jgi:hypothetical protein
LPATKSFGPAILKRLRHCSSASPSAAAVSPTTSTAVSAPPALSAAAFICSITSSASGRER